MKPIFIIVSILWMILAACARLPQLRPEIDAGASADSSDCAGLFAQGDWQFVHAIEATPPTGQRHTLLGVCRISSDDRTIRSALMTLEGLVIFQADYDGQITVRRALPPFDAKGFAEGLIDDLSLIFLTPGGTYHRGKAPESDARVCRWRNSDGSAVDVLHFPDLSWEIRRYNAKAQPIRSVKPLNRKAVNGKGPTTESIVLQSPGLLGYTLTMTLVDAQPMIKPKPTPEVSQ